MAESKSHLAKCHSFRYVFFCVRALLFPRHRGCWVGRFWLGNVFVVLCGTKGLGRAAAADLLLVHLEGVAVLHVELEEESVTVIMR